VHVLPQHLLRGGTQVGRRTDEPGLARHDLADLRRVEQALPLGGVGGLCFRLEDVGGRDDPHDLAGPIHDRQAGHVRVRQDGYRLRDGRVVRHGLHIPLHQVGDSHHLLLG